ncbi:MAG: hypothetical protein K5768_06920 [Firmicutes bacterium]|nr:hypothetical protein [Bacillota bacterium]
MKKWINYIFEDYESRIKSDFSDFSDDLKAEIKRQIQDFGYEIKKYSTGYFFISGFVYNPQNGRFAYFNVGDVRDTGIWHNRILVREARSDKDYSGGINHFVNLDSIGKELQKILERSKSEFERVKVSRGAI